MYGGWYIKREVNAWLYYDDSTLEMMCNNLKPESFKDYAVCKDFK